MGARLNKKEKEIYEQVIKEELKKGSNPLRITWEIRITHGQRRHTMHEVTRIVRRMIKRIK